MNADKFGWLLWAIGGVLMVVGWLAHISDNLGLAGFVACFVAIFVRSYKSTASNENDTDTLPEQNEKKNDV